MQKWRETHEPARLEEILEDGVVKCHLSPRGCKMKDGQHGFCGVRANRGGRLVTLNYGKSVHATEETIETEAVNHFYPGDRILSMGNIGCMFNCSYCHNWKTSQAKYVEDKDVYHYSPEDVVDIALRHGIRVLSWTYNDPVVWHEFVRDTAKLGKEAGLINLYKSAFYITERAVDELLPHIDIFSISLKSMDPEYYRKYTKGRLEPVLDAVKQVYAAGKHVEVSSLMITDISDDIATGRSLAEWVLDELDNTVPMHLVRFHPDYKMRDTVRTPVSRLIAARQEAANVGVKHVYLGNVYDTEFSNTYCGDCGELLVDRYGLNAHVVGLALDGNCRSCGWQADMKMSPGAVDLDQRDSFSDPGETREFQWRGDVRSLHVQVLNSSRDDSIVAVRRVNKDQNGSQNQWQVRTVAPDESYRFIVAKSAVGEDGCEVFVSENMTSNLHEVFDRAHFPTLSVDQVGLAETDVVPLPIFDPSVRVEKN